jgi:hypothetical protein
LQSGGGPYIFANNPFEIPPTPQLLLTCPFHRHKILRQ